jgi:hypothetical protein
MATTLPTTPTSANAEAETEDLRPVVGRPVSNRSVWIFSGVAALAAVLLYTALEARRAAVAGLTTAARPPPRRAISPLER